MSKETISHSPTQEHEHTHGTVDPMLFASQKGLKAVMSSSIVLFVGSLFQLAVVILSGSVSLLSDTIHNLGDGATAIPLSIAFLIGRRKPNNSFTYGYGKAEDLAGVTILLFMLASALYAAYVSINRLFHPYTPTHLWVIAIASLVGFGINEGAAIFRIKVGEQIHSEALVTDGKHARMDGFTSLAVLVGAFGTYLGYPIVDPIVGLFITVLILHTIWEQGQEVFKRMLDGVDPELVKQVNHAVREVAGVKSITETRVRWIGHFLHAEVTIAVDPNLTVEEGHEVSCKADHQLREHLPHLSHIFIHVVPLHSPHEEHHHDDEGQRPL
ncbi:MAG TPA: cation diffusion facilitator family transporter [Candidatus Sulfotelmatobacter sp.]|jgi:cation diffusion facilitator family transporter|nr:cation diffusion facilitator family transporter [Candidatus Sulfotelmatobacter sp.]